jgi:dihydropteroate synthase
VSVARPPRVRGDAASAEAPGDKRLADVGPARPAHRLRARDRVLELGARPLLMGIVNASPDSFSDDGRHRTLEQRVVLAHELVAAGADILDVGGESATTGRPPVAVDEEIARVVPLVERIVAECGHAAGGGPPDGGPPGGGTPGGGTPGGGAPGGRPPGGGDPAEIRTGERPGPWAGRRGGGGDEGGDDYEGAGPLVSVDTYKPAVAAAALAAGAHIVNDVSGLRDPALAAVCARSGAALVVMHTAAAPRERRQDPHLYGDVVAETLDFLRARIALALDAGVAREQLIVDPGPDFAKTPAQTIELLAATDRLHTLGLPLLMAISRKDFIGALTGRPPRERLAGTLAALAHGLDAGAHIFRVHDVAAAADFVAVRAALAGEQTPAPTLALADGLRRERARA